MSELSVDEITAKLLEEISVITGKTTEELDRKLSLAHNGINSMGFVELLLTVAKNWNVNLIDAGICMADVNSVESLAVRVRQELVR